MGKAYTSWCQPGVTAPHHPVIRYGPVDSPVFDVPPIEDAAPAPRCVRCHCKLRAGNLDVVCEPCMRSSREPISEPVSERQIVRGFRSSIRGRRKDTVRP